MCQRAHRIPSFLACPKASRRTILLQSVSNRWGKTKANDETKEGEGDVTKNTKPKQKAAKAELKGETVVKREQTAAARQSKPKKTIAPIMEISSDNDVDEATCQRIRSQVRSKISLKPRPTPSPKKPEMIFLNRHSPSVLQRFRDVH